MLTFADVNDDILIHFFAFLSIPDILVARQVSKRMHALSKLRIVWQRALEIHVLDRGFPFPNIDVDAIDSAELEARTRRAYRLGLFWKTPAARPHVVRSFSAGNSATGIAQLHFLPGRPECLVTLTKGIWSVLTCWDIWDIGNLDNQPRALAEWSPKQTLITAIAINSDPHSEACLAVSLTCSGDNAQSIQLMELDFRERQFVPLRTIKTSFRAMTLRGDILAASDDVNETHVINWKTEEYVVLWGSDEPSEHNFQHNHCLQVMFAPHSIFVVRARSLEIFLEPTLRPKGEVTSALYNRPTGSHRFGWIDGIAMSVQKYSARGTGLPPLSIVLRAESDDPWASDVHTLDLYTLQPNPDFKPGEPARWTPSDAPCGQTSPKDSSADASSRPALSPYLFPPVCEGSWASKRGHLRCREILVGAHGTALWIQPRPARNLDLVALDVHSSSTQRPGPYSPHGAEPARESLVAALLPGRLKDTLAFARQLEQEEVGEGGSEGMDMGMSLKGDGDGPEGVRMLFAFDGPYGMWRCIDYDEAGGMIALGDSLGHVEVLELAGG